MFKLYFNKFKINTAIKKYKTFILLILFFASLIYIYKTQIFFVFENIKNKHIYNKLAEKILSENMMINCNNLNYKTGNFSEINRSDIKWECYNMPVNFSEKFKELKVNIYRFINGRKIIESTQCFIVPSDNIYVGTILFWNGPVNSIPTNKGWQLCDGTNGTPDLRGRFIYGAGAPNYVVQPPKYDESNHSLNPDTIQNKVNNRPGEETHSLTEGENPSHYHNQMWFSFGIVAGLLGIPCPAMGGMGNTDTSGAGEPHENMPPYYTLCMIMKVR